MTTNSVMLARVGVLDFLGRRLARFLSKPIKGHKTMATCDPGRLERALAPGDVLLVEGMTRISTAIKYLTQSTWSHAALCVGPIRGRREPDGEPHVMVEAEIDLGVISSPLSKYQNAHTRICRPVGLTDAEIESVIAFAVVRIGYDCRFRAPEGQLARPAANQRAPASTTLRISAWCIREPASNHEDSERTPPGAHRELCLQITRIRSQT